MTRRSTALVGAALLSAAVLATGCGEDTATTGATPAAPTTTSAEMSPAAGAMPAGGGLTVREAVDGTTEGPLLVRGHIVVTGADARLCDALLRSMPPRCGGASLALEGLPDDAVTGLETRGGVRWSPAPVALLGPVRDGVLTVDPTRLAAS